MRKGRITAGQIQTSPELLWKLNLFPEARSAPAGCRGWALKQQPCNVFPQTVCVCHPAAPCFALAQVEGGRHCFLLGFLTPIHPQLSKSGSFAFLLLFSVFFPSAWVSVGVEEELQVVQVKGWRNGTSGTSPISAGQCEVLVKHLYWSTPKRCSHKTGASHFAEVMAAG